MFPPCVPTIGPLPFVVLPKLQPHDDDDVQKVHPNQLADGDNSVHCVSKLVRQDVGLRHTSGTDSSAKMESDRTEQSHLRVRAGRRSPCASIGNTTGGSLKRESATELVSHENDSAGGYSANLTQHI